MSILKIGKKITCIIRLKKKVVGGATKYTSLVTKNVLKPSLAIKCSFLILSTTQRKFIISEITTIQRHYIYFV